MEPGIGRGLGEIEASAGGSSLKASHHHSGIIESGAQAAGKARGIAAVTVQAQGVGVNAQCSAIDTGDALSTHDGQCLRDGGIDRFDHGPGWPRGARLPSD